MKIVEFYRGERPNNEGDTLEEIMQFTHYELEADHDYIQWMFPSNEPSKLNGDSPTMTLYESDAFSSSAELQEKVLLSFEKILDFLGFQLVRDPVADRHIIEDIAPTDERPHPQRWTYDFNHNMLRVTRILKCLRLTGLTAYALAFHDALMRHSDKFSLNTKKYWNEAITLPLWPNE